MEEKSSVLVKVTSEFVICGKFSEWWITQLFIEKQISRTRLIFLTRCGAMMWNELLPVLTYLIAARSILPSVYLAETPYSNISKKTSTSRKLHRIIHYTTILWSCYYSNNNDKQSFPDTELLFLGDFHLLLWFIPPRNSPGCFLLNERWYMNKFTQNDLIFIHTEFSFATETSLHVSR